MERIGIYGGTFNPPHVGHLRAAEAAMALLRLDRLILMPAFCSPDKQTPEVSAEHRLQMLRLAAKPDMEVSELEIARGGTSYTVDTLRQLREMYPDAELVLLLGSDSFEAFLSWKAPEEILKLASLAVLCRGGKKETAGIEQQKKRLEEMGGKIYRVDNPVTEISSSNLRRMLAFGCGREFLPEGVEACIRNNGLYDTRKNWKKLPMEQLEKVVISLLKPNRVRHVLGCRDTAAELARIWGADENDAARAGMLHDVTKALDGPLQLTLCRAYQKSQDPPRTDGFTGGGSGFRGKSGGGGCYLLPHHRQGEYEHPGKNHICGRLHGAEPGFSRGGRTPSACLHQFG